MREIMWYLSSWIWFTSLSTMDFSSIPFLVISVFSCHFTLSKIPLYVCTTFSSSVLDSKLFPDLGSGEYCINKYGWLNINNMHVDLGPLRYMPGVSSISGSCFISIFSVFLFLIPLRNLHIDFHSDGNIVMYKVSIFFHILARISCFLRIVILIGVRWKIKTVIILISLMI